MKLDSFEIADFIYKRKKTETNDLLYLYYKQNDLPYVSADLRQVQIISRAHEEKNSKSFLTVLGLTTFSADALLCHHNNFYLKL